MEDLRFPAPSNLHNIRGSLGRGGAGGCGGVRLSQLRCSWDADMRQKRVIGATDFLGALNYLEKSLLVKYLSA